jgi:hypothetical protein
MLGYIDNRGLDTGALTRVAKKPDKSPALVLRSCDWHLTNQLILLK